MHWAYVTSGEEIKAAIQSAQRDGGGGGGWRGGGGDAFGMFKAGRVLHLRIFF